MLERQLVLEEECLLLMEHIVAEEDRLGSRDPSFMQSTSQWKENSLCKNNTSDSATQENAS